MGHEPEGSSQTELIGEGGKRVELLADGEKVVSADVFLKPGEEKEITLPHRFQEAGPRILKIGHLPIDLCNLCQYVGHFP